MRVARATRNPQKGKQHPVLQYVLYKFYRQIIDLCECVHAVQASGEKQVDAFVALAFGGGRGFCMLLPFGALCGFWRLLQGAKV